MSMREQMKVIVEEIRDGRDKEILEFIDVEIKACSAMVLSAKMDTSKMYWDGRLTQTLAIKNFIINGRNDK